MIGYIASIITSLLIKRKVVTEDEKEIYKYGFEIIFSTILGFLIVIILGVAADSLLTSAIFIMVFCSLRFKCGGYHANSYLSCNIVFTMVFMVVLLVENFSEKFMISPAILIMIYLLGFVVIHVYAPVENVNKPLDEDDKKKGKRESYILYTIWSIVGLILYPCNYNAMVSLTTTILMVILLMLAGAAKERKLKYAENGK